MNKRIRNNNTKINKQDSSKKNPKSIGHNIRKPHTALLYKQVKLDEHIKSKVINLKPTNIPENISSIFLPKIWETINKSIQKDIDELYTVYLYKLWTPTTLMAYRTLENVLKVHITHDLKESSINSITNAIQVLKKHKYDSKLLAKLSKFNNERNDYMHGNKRAGSDDAKKIVSDIISITMHIHNIKP